MTPSRQKLKLLGIFALFFGPVILVMMMRSPWWGYQPAGTSNRGHLVEPPVRLALDSVKGIEGQWLILHELDTSQPCERTCMEAVTDLRQVHKAAGRNRDQVAIVILGRGVIDDTLKSRLTSIYDEFHYLDDEAGRVKETLDAIDLDTARTNPDKRPFDTFVVDPMHNVVLAYEKDASAGDVHKDLGRLLKWSHKEPSK